MLPPLRLSDTLQHRTHGPGKNNSVTVSSETGEVCTLHLQTDDFHRPVGFICFALFLYL